MKKFALSKVRDDLYQLENDPRFLNRMTQARASIREGGGIRLEELESDPPSSRDNR
jgi:hypothetical protein